MKLLIILIITIASISCKLHTKEIFYFNSNLDFFVVIYDVECASELKKNSNDEWEYFIPDSGVLLLNNKREQGGVINMEAYEKVQEEYKLHCRISPFEEDFGEPRGGIVKKSFSYNKKNVCGNSERFEVDLYVYVVNYKEDTDERIKALVRSVLFNE